MRAIRFFIWTFLWLVAFLCAAWATGALYFDFPFFSAPVAIAFVALLFAAIIFLRGKVLKFTAVLGGFVAVLCWWFTLKPSNDRQWQPDVTESG